MTEPQSGISGAANGFPYTRAHKKQTIPYATNATLKSRRLTDQDFRLWPALVFRCEVCGWPIDRVTYPVHPLCEVTL